MDLEKSKQYVGEDILKREDARPSPTLFDFYIILCYISSVKAGGGWNMKRFAVFFLVLFMLMSLFSGQRAQAVKSECSEAAASEKGKIGKPASSGNNVGKALNNACCGWTEIPKNVASPEKNTNPVAGFFVNLFRGTCKAFNRTVVGVSKLVTLPLGEYEKPTVLPNVSAS